MLHYLPLLVVFGLLFLFWTAMRSAVGAANPGHRLDAIAASLGLSIVEGDPMHNLVTGPRGNLLLHLFGVTKHDAAARLAGQTGPFACTFELREKLLRVKLRHFVVYESDTFVAELTL